jgi:L-arabinonolactonase
MNVFCDEENELGEGPLWHSQRNSLFWLDILERKLFEKRFESRKSGADNNWLLPEYASAMAQDKYDENILWMVTNKSFGKYDLTKCSYFPVLKLGISESFRANDGGVSPDGAFWFGTMEWSPSGINGSVYSISPGGLVKEQGIKIGIPNTFCWQPSGKAVYISDSFQQKIYSFEVKNQQIINHPERVLVDLTKSGSTPDGGAVDNAGYLWNAHWDGHKVVKYDRDGEIHEEIHMPVPRPTSCCFGGPTYQHLFVTSARTMMSKEEVAKYPSSGNVFVSEQSTAGRRSPAFCLDR